MQYMHISFVRLNGELCCTISYNYVSYATFVTQLTDLIFGRRCCHWAHVH